ncbi:MAG: DNA-processing protein DprA [Firmicutes bacterium]|nr:DNA-processing protein DprA [Bacillota bacterium]
MRDNEKATEIEVITSGDPAYPARLKEIKDYPRQLYFRGGIGMLKKRCVAVVGSRTTTTYGRNTARAIAARLASRGVTVISGMAAGIDACAHEGALNAGGETAAVLGCGPDICYPKQNRPLMSRLETQGLLLSEYEPGTPPEYWRFPQRNRIISGLSEVTVVVQARGRSGALITAELAAEQGREVFAVPGNIDSQYNLGTNKLIQEGAAPLIRVDDILDALGLNGRDEKAMLTELTPLEQQVWQVIRDRGEMGLEEICMVLDDRPQRISPVLSVMEIKGFLHSASGKFFLANR